MEDKINFEKCLNTYKELKESAQIYYNCINLRNANLLLSPTLKYTLYNEKLNNAFKYRIKSINCRIEKLKKNLKNYKGKKIDLIYANIKLDEISKKLTALDKEAEVDTEFYTTYLAKIAKKFDVFNMNEEVKNVYFKSSEDIINSIIKYYLNKEKSFIIFTDIIKQLNLYLNNN